MADQDINIKVQLEGIDEATAKINKLKSSLKDSGGEDPFKKYDSSTKGFTKNLGDVNGAMELLPERFQGVIGAVQTFSKALLASPLGWIFLAITAVVGALTLLGKAFIGTDEGGLKFAIIMKQISQIVDVVMNRIAELAKGLSSFLSGNFTEGVKQMGSAFNGLSTEIGNAAEAGKQYAIALDEIEDKQNRFISQEAEMQGQIAQLNYIAADQTKSSKERLNALLQVQSIEKGIAQEKIDIAQAQFDADVNLASNGNKIKKDMMLELVNANETTFNELMKKPLYANLWDSKEFQYNFKKLEEGKAKVIASQNEVAETGRRTQMKITGFQKEEASKAKQIADKRLADEMTLLKAQADAYQKNVTDIESFRSKAQANILTHEENLNKNIVLNSKESFDQQLQGIKDLTAKKIALKQQEIDKLNSFTGPETPQELQKRMASISSYETEIVLINDNANQEMKTNDQAYYDWQDSQNQAELDKADKNAKSVVEAKTKAQEKLLTDLGNLATLVEGLGQNMFGPIQTAADNFYIAMNDKNLTWQEQLKAGLQVLSAVSNEIFAQMSKSRDEQLQKDLDSVAKEFEGQYTSLQDLKDKKLISDAEYNKRKEKLDKEQAAKELALKKKKAQEDKTAAIIQAVINTALAITAALATPVIGIAMAVIAGVLGAAQIAYIASQPLAYKKGGLVPKYATGGLLSGSSHEQGGIPINAEGGEYIINKTTTQKPGMLNYLNGINNNSIQPQQNTVSFINKDDLQTIINGVTSIPVVNVESESTRVQKKVANIETKSSW